MQGKTVVLTGATSGIGEAAAVRLASLGARLVIVGRDPARTDAVLAKLRAANPDTAHVSHLADLSRLQEMKRVAAEIAAEPRIDVLVNNAGGFFLKRQITDDGLERTFALNHMAYFVVTAGLLDRIKASPDSRVVSTASAAHHGMRLDVDELTRTQWAGESYDGLKAYGRSKLCNVLWTRALARRLQGSGVSAVCLHPGVVRTRIFDGAGALSSIVKVVSPAFLSPEKGADTLVWLASSPDAESRTGGYFVKRKPARTDATARDEALGERLWAESARITDAG